jgi:hypothetical protein
MYCPLCRLPILRRLRAAVSRLAVFIASQLIGACAGGDNHHERSPRPGA